MVYREGERKFCMGEGTEDRTQAYMKHVVLEPEHEKEYAQPLLTLFDELLAWDLASGDSRIIFYTEGSVMIQRAGAGCGKTGQSRNFRHLPGAMYIPGSAAGSGHFSAPCT